MLFRIRPLVVLAAALLALGAASARALLLAGTLTDLTADTAASARLTLTLAGENATAALAVQPPLVGTGRLAGRYLSGWLELSGQVGADLTLHFRGALNGSDYRGTYLAATPGQPLHYGKFHFTVEK